MALWTRARKTRPVVRNGHSEEQILRALRRAERGTRVGDICREHGSREATFDIWNRSIRNWASASCASSGSCARGTRSLSILVGNLLLDHILQEIVKEKL